MNWLFPVGRTKGEKAEQILIALLCLSMWALTMRDGDYLLAL